MEDCHTHGYPVGGGREFHMETVYFPDGNAGIRVETESEIHCPESTGDGAVCPSEKSWETVFRKRHKRTNSAAEKEGVEE